MPYIKEINIEVITEDGGIGMSFMKSEKIQDILQDKKTLLGDFIAHLISNVSLEK